MRKRMLILTLLICCPLLGHAQTAQTTMTTPETYKAVIARIADDIWNQGKLDEVVHQAWASTEETTVCLVSVD